MNSPSLFYVSGCADLGSVFELDGAEAQHIVGAKRLRVGDAIEITDGHGYRLVAQISQIGLRQKSLGLIRISSEAVAPPSTQIVLASAVAKGDRQSTLIDMACQLGITQLWPMQCDFSAVKYSEKAAQRWQRIIVEGCKQSRRVWFPQIRPLTTVEDLLRKNSTAVRLLGHQFGQSLGHYQNEISDAETVILLVGPEGGFSDRELALAEKWGVRQVSLGQHILRIETACSAIIAAVNQFKK